ncbi:MAG: hypothetical protein AAGH76_02820 [Pseudomonadota bacterium]
MKCSEICYRLRVHILLLMALIALGSAAQLGGFATANVAEPTCKQPEDLVCLEGARVRRNSCRCATANAQAQPSLPVADAFD